MQREGWVSRTLALARVDFKPAVRQPATLLVLLATAVALGASLGADRLLVAAGTSVFPSTTGYVHFRFGDYAELTVIGVIVACLAWPVTARLTTQPRWLFLRLALAVTIVLLAPDAWLLLRNQPARAVAVLVAMHLVIALITYNLLVHAAPAGTARTTASTGGTASTTATSGTTTTANTTSTGGTGGTGGTAITAITAITAASVRTAGVDRRVASTTAPPTTASRSTSPPPSTVADPASEPPLSAAADPGERAPGELRPSRTPWLAMFGLLMAESVVGIWALIAVPNNRPNALLPTDGRTVFLVHAVIGAALGIGALLLIVTRGRTNRLSFNCALVGLISTAVAGAGGSLTTYKSDRLVGAGLMLVGAVVAAFAYLTPAAEPAERKPPGMATNYNAAPWPGRDQR